MPDNRSNESPMGGGPGGPGGASVPTEKADNFGKSIMQLASYCKKIWICRSVSGGIVCYRNCI